MPQIHWGKAQEKRGCLFTGGQMPFQSQLSWYPEPEGRIPFASPRLSPRKRRAKRYSGEFVCRASFALSQATKFQHRESLISHKGKGDGPMFGWPTIQTIGLLVKSCWKFQSLVRTASVRPIAFLHLRFFRLTAHLHRNRSHNSFHEKAGMSQVCFFLSVFFFLPVDSLHSSLAASVAILPSALFVERFSLGAWWAFPISVGAAT